MYVFPETNNILNGSVTLHKYCKVLQHAQHLLSIRLFCNKCQNKTLNISEHDVFSKAVLNT